MRKFHLLMVFFAIVQCAIAQDTITITGFVRDSVTKEPLPGAIVQILGTPFNNHTDLDGIYRIRGALSKDGMIKVTMMGYIEKKRHYLFAKRTRNNFYLSVDANCNQDERHRYRLSNNLEGMPRTTVISSSFALGGITGEVRDATSDKPISNATINVLGKNIVHQTDSMGTFSISKIRVGKYFLQAKKEGFYLSDTITIRVLYDNKARANIFLKLIPDSTKP